MKKQIIQFFIAVCLVSLPLMAQALRTEPVSPIDRQFMQDQHDSIDDLARRNFGRQLNGHKDNDFAIMQRLLDENIVTASQKAKLQAMGLILGNILQSQYGLNWIVYFDKYGRSRSLQVPGYDRDFIFPVTQVSRKAEVGIRVNIAEVYQELEQSIVNIRNRPLL
ncbi:MAG: DUF3806 domain-containing protein [Oceanicoccus sp.]